MRIEPVFSMTVTTEGVYFVLSGVFLFLVFFPLFVGYVRYVKLG